MIPIGTDMSAHGLASFEGLPALTQPAATRDPEAARAAAREFESVFLGQMLEHMFAGVRTDGLFGGGHGETVYRSLLLTEHGRSIARSGGIGVADHVMAEILRLQEGTQS